MNKADTQKRIEYLERENTVLQLALSDHVRGKVTWLRKGPARLGISRELGAAGGIVIHRQGSDVCGAYYWEKWFEGVRNYVPSSSNKEGHQLRECAFAVQAHIAAQQRAILSVI